MNILPYYLHTRLKIFKVISIIFAVNGITSSLVEVEILFGTHESINLDKCYEIFIQKTNYWFSYLIGCYMAKLTSFCSLGIPAKIS